MVSCTITMRRSSGATPANAISAVFGDRIILAIAGTAGEGDERRTPDVDLAKLREIAHRPDGQIDRAVDLAEAGASVAVSARSVDDGEQSQRGRRHAAFAVAVAQRQLNPFVVELALDVPAILPAGRRRKAARRTARTARRRFATGAEDISVKPACRREAPPPVRTTPCHTQVRWHATRASDRKPI